MLLTSLPQLCRKVTASSSGHFNLCQQFLFTDHKCTLDFCIVILCNNVKDKHSEACLIMSRSTFFPLQFRTPLNLKILEYIYFSFCCIWPYANCLGFLFYFSSFFMVWIICIQNNVIWQKILPHFPYVIKFWSLAWKQIQQCNSGHYTLYMH